MEASFTPALRQRQASSLLCDRNLALRQNKSPVSLVIETSLTTAVSDAKSHPSLETEVNLTPALR